MKPGWVPALRIARRDARRARGRSILIMAMVAIPVFGATSTDLIARSMQLDPSEAAARTVGQADAVLTWQGTSIEQANFDGWRGQGPPLAQQTPIGDLLPAGSRVIESRTGGRVLTTASGRARFPTTELSYDDPLLAGLLTQVTGRAPQGPGEIVATTAALDHLGASIGDTVKDADGKGSWVIVGTVRNDSKTRGELLIGDPGTFGGDSVSWYVDVPGAMTWPQLEKLNAAGYLAGAGRPIAGTQGHKDIHVSSDGNAGALAAITIAVALLILEVALMAGAAFAVGLRRQSRQLAVLAAAGADRVNVRRVVLAGGVVLGVAGAVVGAVGGVLVGLGILAWLSAHASSLPGHVDLRPLELAAALLLGIVAGLLAAWLPARAAARQDVVAALTGRRAEGHPKARVPLVGAGMIVLGVALTLWGAGSLSRRTAVALVGLVLTQLGFVICAPSVLGLVARLGRFLPTVPRMAVRDLARHRSRSGAAVAAVLVAVAGSVAVGVFANSKDAQSRAAYAPYMPVNSVYVDTAHPDRGGSDAGSGDPQAVATISRILTASVPGSSVVALGMGSCAGGNCGDLTAIRQDGGSDCPPDDTGGFCVTQHTILTGDIAALRVVLGRVDTAAEAAYAAGKVLVFDPIFLKNGTVQLLGAPGGGASGDVAVRVEPKRSVLPAVLVQQPLDNRVAAAVAFVPPATGASIGMSPDLTLVFARTSAPVSNATLDATAAALATAGIRDPLQKETGYDGSVATLLLVLLLASSLVTIGGVAVATGLAAADGRDDVATLAAVGASPRIRRLLVGSQAGGVGVVGALVGIVAGVIPAYALLHGQGRTPLVVPWPTLLVTAFAVPVVASVLCGAVVRNQLPIERRTG